MSDLSREEQTLSCMENQSNKASQASLSWLRITGTESAQGQADLQSCMLFPVDNQVSADIGDTVSKRHKVLHCQPVWILVVPEQLIRMLP